MAMFIWRRCGVFGTWLLACGLFAFGVLPSRAAAQADSRKTVEISATEKVQVPAEIATVKVGYQNQGQTKDAAYAESTRVINKVVKALVDAGVPREAIETETLSLTKDEDRFGNRSAQAMPYSANQLLRIQTKASDAEKIVDIAIAAGANHIEDVEWSVADPQQLETKAYAAALTRAKALAEQTATQAGLKLGEIVSVVNSADAAGRFGRADSMKWASYQTVEVNAAKLPMLELHPATVERRASVTVTYAIAP